MRPDLAWGADNFNFNQGPIDRRIEFANNTTPGDNVVVRDCMSSNDYGQRVA